MSRIIRADYGQLLLLPPSVDEWVPADHPARFVRDFVDALDLEAMGIDVPEGRDGRPAYAADLLLKVWLYGYYSKIRSTRRLERACYDSMAMIWLTGNHPPDHNTLWRFWKTNKTALRGLFKKSVAVAIRSDLVSFALQAIDGTKIVAESSTAKAWHRKGLKKLLAKLDEAIAEVCSQTEANESGEDGSCRLSESMADAHRRREKIVEALAELDEAERDRMHPGERDATVVRCAEGKRLGYNAQAVTEEKSHVIVGAEVTNESNDMAQLNTMAEVAEATTEVRAEQIVADGGYFTGKQIAQAASKGRDVVVAVPEVYGGDGSRFHRANFVYDARRDVFVCPMGQDLSYWRAMRPRRDWGQGMTRVYRCRGAEACVYRKACTQQARGRTINKDVYYDEVQRQIEKQKSPHLIEALRKRKQIAELPFARIKQGMGFRRWTVRGLENVRTQWSMLCVALNLQVLYKSWRQGRLVMT